VKLAETTLSSDH